MEAAVRAGRPPNARTEQAILDATRELLAEGGVRGLTVEGFTVPGTQAGRPAPGPRVTTGGCWSVAARWYSSPMTGAT